MGKVDHRIPSETFLPVSRLRVSQFLSIIIDHCQANDEGLKFIDQITYTYVADGGVPQMGPVRKNIVVEPMPRADRSDPLQAVNRELKREFKRMTTVVEDRHRKCVPTPHHLLVDDSSNEFLGSLKVAVHIILFVALNANASVPFSIANNLKKGIYPYGGYTRFAHFHLSITSSL